jgi:hypothetical protein
MSRNYHLNLNCPMYLHFLTNPIPQMSRNYRLSPKNLNYQRNQMFHSFLRSQTFHYYHYFHWYQNYHWFQMFHSFPLVPAHHLR